MGGKNRRGRKSSPPHQGDVKRGRADEVVVRPVHHVVSETGELPNDAVARLFHVAEKRCNHKKAANCTENPNCLTGLARPRTGPVWDEDALAALVHKTTGEVESPAEVLRDATVVVLAPDDVHAANAAAQVEAATGLRNMGATCYMNALLQVLFAIAPLRRGLYQYAGPRQGATVAHHVVDELVLLFARMQQGNAKWLRPHMLPELLDFSTSEQQDVQEFFQLFLGNVCEPALKSCPATSALLQTLFEGHVRKGTVCPLCNVRGGAVFFLFCFVFFAFSLVDQVALCSTSPSVRRCSRCSVCLSTHHWRRRLRPTRAPSSSRARTASSVVDAGRESTPR